MSFSSRAGAVVVVLSFVAGSSLRAQMPPDSPDTPPPATTTTAPVYQGATTAAAPAIDPAKEAEIRKLLQETGTVKIVNQMLQQMMAVMRARAGSNLPPEFWDDLQKEMDPAKLVAKLIPVYDKYYTLDDLKAVNAFYETPAGQHMLQAQPQIMKESMSIGQEWGREAGMKAMLEIQNYKQRMPATPSPTNSAAPPTAPASSAGTPPPSSNAPPP